MKRILSIILIALFLTPASYAEEISPIFNLGIFKNDTREIKSLLNSQVRYANKTNFDK